MATGPESVLYEHTVNEMWRNVTGNTHSLETIPIDQNQKKFAYAIKTFMCTYKANFKFHSYILGSGEVKVHACRNITIKHDM